MRSNETRLTSVKPLRMHTKLLHEERILQLLGLRQDAVHTDRHDKQRVYSRFGL